MMLRNIGTTDIKISSVALGCWPISGMTSLDVNDADSSATLRAAVDAGVNFLDTAYCYGRDGESERLIAELLKGARPELVIATKGGIAWDENGRRVIDGRPEVLVRQCEESLDRLQTDYVDLLYLHAPDPNTPVEESAEGLRDLLKAGKTRSIGLSNVTLDQLKSIHQVCPVSAIQPPYNMLQRQIESDLVPWCLENTVSIIVYWPLLKGLLAGKLARDHKFLPGDGRAKYPMFQGEEWQRNQDFIDELKQIAAESQRSVTELVVNWTIAQPGITSALCGAKRAYQIEESAAAMTWELSHEENAKIDAALKKRGVPLTMSAV